MNEGQFVPHKITNPKKFAAFDTKQHWCDFCCKEFSAVGQLLTHFYSSEHLKYADSCQPINFEESAEEKIENDTILKPIKGTEFIKPLHSFYCTLCNESLLSKSHAQQHLKGHTHTFNYYKHYIEEKPTYELKRELRRTMYKNGLMKNNTDFSKISLHKNHLENKELVKSANTSNSVKKISRKGIGIKIRDRIMIGKMPSYKSCSKLHKKFPFKKTKIDDETSLSKRYMQNNEICKDAEKTQIQRKNNDIYSSKSTVKTLSSEIENEKNLSKKSKFGLHSNAGNNEILETNLGNLREAQEIFLKNEQVTDFNDKNQSIKLAMNSSPEHQSSNLELFNNNVSTCFLQVKPIAASTVIIVNDTNCASKSSDADLLSSNQINITPEQISSSFSTQTGKIYFQSCSQEKKAQSMSSTTPQEIQVQVDLLPDSSDLNTNPLSSSLVRVPLTPKNLVAQSKYSCVSTSTPTVIANTKDMEVDTETFDSKREIEMNVVMSSSHSSHSLKRKCPEHSISDSIMRHTKKLAKNPNSVNETIQNIEKGNRLSFETSNLNYNAMNSDSSELNSVTSVSESNKNFIPVSKTLLNCENTVTNCTKFRLLTENVSKDIFRGHTTSDIKVITNIEGDFEEYVIESQKVLTSIINIVTSNNAGTSELIKIKNEEASLSFYAKESVTLSSPKLERENVKLLSPNSDLPFTVTANDVSEFSNNSHFPLKTELFDDSMISEYALKENTTKLEDTSLVNWNLANLASLKDITSKIVQEMTKNLSNKTTETQLLEYTLKENKEEKTVNDFETSEKVTETERLLAKCREFSIPLRDILQDYKEVSRSLGQYWKKRKLHHKRYYYPPHNTSDRLKSKNEVKNYCKKRNIAFPDYLFSAKQRKNKD